MHCKSGPSSSLRICRIMLYCLMAASLAGAQTTSPVSTTVIAFDASAPVSPPPASDFHGGSATSPSGHTIGVNTRYLTLDGKPWLPVMGEFHYSRYPENRWEEEILKMKAGGVDIVSTYIFWIHHEEIEGQFDWSGQRDLRHFVELCAKHGLYVYPRIGPWAHGETRNGGLPDWLLAKVKTPRSNDPEYLSYVQRYYAQIGEQLKGLMWKDGGPIIGIQLENEYSMRGPGAGVEHILKLKKMAIANGMDVPLYTETAWDNAAIPPAEVLPVSGGYPDAPWDSSIQQLPPNGVYSFHFARQVAGNMGAIGAKQADADQPGTKGIYPFLSAEMGGGIQDTYHRRPVISADDIAAMATVMLGSGVNLYGTYMFQGGENPDGKLSTLQESQVTKYATDVPVKSYDFQAPLGEFGEERESFRKLKLVQYFMNDFGALLAPMTPHAPATLPANDADFSVLRASVRSAGDSGFLFANNFVRQSTLSQRRGIQFAVALPGETLQIPRKPVDIPAGAYLIWPFNLDLNGVRLKYSTAQLFTRVEEDHATDYIFFAVPGIPPEFAIDASTLLEATAKGRQMRREDAMAYVTGGPTGFDSPIVLKSKQGDEIRIFVLDQRQAENTWKVSFQGKPHLVTTSAQIFSDEQQMYLQSLGNAKFSFEVMPRLDEKPTGSQPLTAHGGAHGISCFSATMPEKTIAVEVRKLQDAGRVAAATLGPPLPWRPAGVAQAPADSAFDRAAKWEITVPPNGLSGIDELFLKVDYIGDVARLSSSGKLLADNFYNGLPWSIGLSRFINGNPFELSILPLHKDSPIYMESALRPEFHGASQVEELRKIELVPQYELTVNTEFR